MDLGHLFIDLSQQRAIGNLTTSVDEIRRALASQHRSSATQDELQQLRHENDELRLYVAVLYRLMLSKGIVSQEEIRAIVRGVDAEDGVLDRAHRGRVTGTAPLTDDEI